MCCIELTLFTALLYAYIATLTGITGRFRAMHIAVSREIKTVV